MSTPITLRCPRCRRKKPYERSVDPRVPATVSVITIICPKCDNGDFHEERWFDANGVELEQDYGDSLSASGALIMGR